MYFERFNELKEVTKYRNFKLFSTYLLMFVVKIFNYTTRYQLRLLEDWLCLYVMLIYNEIHYDARLGTTNLQP